jgi:two-component system chemotaxis response regulator CheB
VPRRFITKKSAVLPYDIIAIGASWGGVAALSALVCALPRDWQVPIVIVQHQNADSAKFLENILSKLTALPVRDIEDKDQIKPGYIYIAPANYHLLVEQDFSFSLSLEAAVNFSRPSIDVTFNSLANIFRQRCIGLILTGANDDGAEGVKAIKKQGGYIIVQSPESAEAPVMPQAAIATGTANAVVTLEAIVPHLLHLLSNGTR